MVALFSFRLLCFRPVYLFQIITTTTRITESIIIYSFHQRKYYKCKWRQNAKQWLIFNRIYSAVWSWTLLQKSLVGVSQASAVSNVAPTWYICLYRFLQLGAATVTSLYRIASNCLSVYLFVRLFFAVSSVGACSSNLVCLQFQQTRSALCCLLFSMLAFCNAYDYINFHNFFHYTHLQFMRYFHNHNTY